MQKDRDRDSDRDRHRDTEMQRHSDTATQMRRWRKKGRRRRIHMQ